MVEQALSDVKVLDLTWHIAGPYCTKMFADLGADVVKVEKPGEGDPARRMGPFFKDDRHPEKSGLFLHLNTNKRGITLNLKSETGKTIFKKLVKDVDILVENFSPRVMPSLGLDYETLEKINPKIVMTSISNFGQTGPYRDFKATEIVEFAMGGEMYSHGLPEREPIRLAGNLIQYQAGTVAAVATMGAFYVSSKQGFGQHVDVSIMETQAGTIDRRATFILGYAYGGVVTNRWPPPQESVKMILGPGGIYPCKDGFFHVLCLPQWFPKFLAMMGKPELKDDPRFQNIFNTEYQGEFDAMWYDWIIEHTKEELFNLALEHGVAAAPVSTSEDLVKSPHLEAREYFVEIDHPMTGEVKYPGAPFRMAETPWQVRRPAPMLGQHNEEIYGQLGYTKEDLVNLRETGVI